MTSAHRAACELVAHAVTAHSAMQLRMLATARQTALAAADAANRLAGAIFDDAIDWTADDADEALDLAGLRIFWRNGGEL